MYVCKLCMYVCVRNVYMYVHVCMYVYIVCTYIYTYVTMYVFIYKHLELMCYIILCSIGYESGSDDDSLTPSSSTTSVDSDKQ